MKVMQFNYNIFKYEIQKYGTETIYPSKEAINCFDGI